MIRRPQINDIISSPKFILGYMRSNYGTNAVDIINVPDDIETEIRTKFENKVIEVVQYDEKTIINSYDPSRQYSHYKVYVADYFNHFIKINIEDNLFYTKKIKLWTIRAYDIKISSNIIRFNIGDIDNNSISKDKIILEKSGIYNENQNIIFY